MKPVLYLENSDINPDGTLKKYVGNGKPVIIMAKASYCRYCIIAEPSFQKFSDSQNKVVAAVIKIDGEESEKKASTFLKLWDNRYSGIPSYFMFSSDGTFKGVHKAGRSTEDLLKASTTLS
jgi:thiol-disulfide isomerase/thioredoxin